ncbi:MAG: hypothetical protein EOO12_00315 [Chitinophagaceae bacterium]|nr:MAG: hypothetical protein EOO12_00315 [Chitinophagaceae bacterium]
MDVPEMVERVARALAKIRYAHVGSDSEDRLVRGTPNWEFCVQDARAAIEAMREPTERMKYVGGTKCEDMMFGGDPDYTGIIFTDMGTVYTTMLSEALSPSLKEQERT